MSDCRYGVSPVNYPDPDPGAGMVSHNVIMEYCVLHPRSDSRNWPRSSECLGSFVSALTHFGPESFRPGSFRSESFRSWVVSALFGRSFRPYI